MCLFLPGDLHVEGYVAGGGPGDIAEQAPDSARTQKEHHSLESNSEPIEESRAKYH